jgi:hypothetical protein
METTVNPHLQRPLPDAIVTATLVTGDDERLQCLPRIAGIRCTLLENTIYDMLGMVCTDYAGGYWDFFTLSNGGFYMAPKTIKTFRLTCENMFEAEVDANTAGLIACGLAYSHLSFIKGGQCFADAYHRLSEFIFQHPEVGTIRAALD